MNPLESQLQYPLGDTLPVFGGSHELQPGLRWVRMPLPFALDHINLWLLRDRFEGRDGWAIIDCGVARDDLRGYWRQVLETELESLPVLRIIVTHMHPDHVGLASWLCERLDVPLFMTMSEYVTARMFSEGGAEGNVNGGERAVAFFRSHGLTDPEALEKIRVRRSYYAELVPSVPQEFHRLLAGDVLRIGEDDWQVIVGYGHSPEHVSLSCRERNVLISGDMVLPRISTNISVYDFEPAADPLRQYLTSLDEYAPLPADTLVLPSHGRPFVGLHTRITQQREHHQARLDEVLEACVTPQSALDIVPVMFKRPLDLHQLTFALGEALAHLQCLERQGSLQRHRDADGVIRFLAHPHD
ncbi:MAG: MBL fold metallo-hydrolase [Pigmentiphaga sp.]